MTDRIEILAQQGAKLSVPLPLKAGTSLIGRAVRMQVRKFAGDTVVQLVASSTDERLLVTDDREMQLEVPSGVMAALLVSEVVELWSYDIYSYSNTDDAIREAEGVFRITKATTRDTEVEPAPTVAGFVSATIPQAWTAEQQQIGRINLGILDGGGGGGGGGGTDDHGALTGLADDDHTQYHNDARADLRYVRFDGAQGLTAPQQLQARENIGAGTGGGGSAEWGDIGGTLSDQTDLVNALGFKLDDLSAGTADTIVTVNAGGTLLSRAAYTIASLISHVVARAQHTGTQLAATISDFASAALAAVTWSTITGKPSTFPPDSHMHPASDVSGLGTAATHNVPASGNAVSGEVVKGSDTRLGDSRAPTAHASSHAPGGSDALPWTTIHGRGVAASRPAAAAGNAGYIYYSTDTEALERSTGSAWESIAPAGGGGGAGTATLARFRATHNMPPASAFAQIDTRNGITVLDFDAALDESAIFLGQIPEGAVLTSGIKARAATMATTATSGNARLRVEFMNLNTDIDSLTWDTATEANAAADATCGETTITEITCTTIDSLAAGDWYLVRFTRVGTDATNDGMSGDLELFGLELRAA